MTGPARAPAQVAEGMLREAAALMAQGLREDSTMATRAIGYAQGIAFLRRARGAGRVVGEERTSGEF